MTSRLSPIVKPRQSFQGTDRHSNRNNKRSNSVGHRPQEEETYIRRDTYSREFLRNPRNTRQSKDSKRSEKPKSVNLVPSTHFGAKQLIQPQVLLQNDVLMPTLRSSRATIPKMKAVARPPMPVTVMQKQVELIPNLVQTHRARVPIMNKRRRNSVDIGVLKHNLTSRKTLPPLAITDRGCGVIPLPVQNKAINLVKAPVPQLLVQNKQVEVLNPRRRDPSPQRNIRVKKRLEPSPPRNILIPQPKCVNQIVVPQIQQQKQVLIPVKKNPPPQPVIISRNNSPDTIKTVHVVPQPLNFLVNDNQDFHKLRMAYDNLTIEYNHIVSTNKILKKENSDLKLNEDKHRQEVDTISLRYRRLIEDLECNIDKLKKNGEFKSDEIVKENMELKKKLMMLENANHQLNLHTSTLDVDKNRLRQELEAMAQQFNHLKGEKNQISFQTSQIMGEKEKLTQIIQTLKQELRVMKEVDKRSKEIEGSEKEFKKAIINYETTIKDLKLKIDNMENLQKNSNNSSDSIGHLLKQIAHLNEENNKLRQAMTDFQLLKNQNDSLKTEISKVNETWQMRVKTSVIELKTRLEKEYDKKLKNIEIKFKTDFKDENRNYESLLLENERLRHELNRIVTENAMNKKKGTNFETEVMKYKEKISILTQKISKMDILEIEKIERINRENLEDFEREKYTMQAEIVYLRQKVIDLEKEAADWRKHVANIENDLVFLKQINLKSHEITKEEFKAKLSSLELNREKFDQREDHVDNLLEEIARLQKEKKELESRNFRNEQTVENLQQENLRNQEDLDNMKLHSQNNMIEITREANNKIISMEKRIAELEDEIYRKNEEIGRLGNIVNEKDQKFDALDLRGMMRKSEHNEELAANGEKLSMMETENLNLKNQLNSLKIETQKEIEDKEDNINELIGELENLGRVLQDMENKNIQLQNANGNGPDLKKIGRLLDEKDNKIEDLTREIEYLKNLKNPQNEPSPPQNKVNPARSKNKWTSDIKYSKLKKSNLKTPQEKNEILPIPEENSNNNINNFGQSSAAFDFLRSDKNPIIQPPRNSGYQGQQEYPQNNQNYEEGNSGKDISLKSFSNNIGDFNSHSYKEDEDVNYELEPAPRQLLSQDSEEVPEKNIFVQDIPNSSQHQVERGRFKTVVPNKITTETNTGRNTISPHQNLNSHMFNQNSQIRKMMEDIQKLKNENENLKNKQNQQSQVIHDLKQPQNKNVYDNPENETLMSSAPNFNPYPSNTQQQKQDFSRRKPPSFSIDPKIEQEKAQNREIQPPGIFTPEGHEPSTRAGYTQVMSQQGGFIPQNRLAAQTQTINNNVNQAPPNNQAINVMNPRAQPTGYRPQNHTYVIQNPNVVPYGQMGMIQSPTLNYTPSLIPGSIEGQQPRGMTNYPSFQSADKLVKELPSISSEKNFDLRRDYVPHVPAPRDNLVSRVNRTEFRLENDFNRGIQRSSTERDLRLDDALKKKFSPERDFRLENQLDRNFSPERNFRLNNQLDRRFSPERDLRLDDQFQTKPTPSARSIASKVTLNDKEQFNLDKKLNSYFKNLDDYLNYGDDNNYGDPPRLSNSSYRDKIAKNRIFDRKKSPEGYKSLVKGDKARDDVINDFPVRVNPYAGVDTYGLRAPEYQNTPAYKRNKGLNEPSYNFRSTRETPLVRNKFRKKKNDGGKKNNFSRNFENLGRKRNPDFRGSDYSKISENDAVSHIKGLEMVANDLQKEIDNFKGYLTKMDDRENRGGLERRVMNMENDLRNFRKELFNVSQSEVNPSEDSERLRRKIRKL